jgi:hypothetical protein
VEALLLRAAVIVVSTIVLIIAGALILSGAAPLTVGVGWIMIQVLVVLVAVIAERGRYRPVTTGSTWVRTTERFQDPTSGRWIVVEYDPRTGERRYVEEGS